MPVTRTGASRQHSHGRLGYPRRAGARSTASRAPALLCTAMARVLIIDDHDSMREGMAVALRKQGHDIAAVRSGVDGIAAYRKQPFDAVVTDLKMEQMDGIE